VELWTKAAIMQGATDPEQLGLISALCGSITADVWPDVVKLEAFKDMDLPKSQTRKVCKRLRNFTGVRI
jgi:cyclin-dependent kinase 9